MQKIKILLVDDEPDVTRILSSVLGAEGMSVRLPPMGKKP